MRVLMFCPQFAPLIGGAERQAEKLGKKLVSEGVDVEVWTPRLDPCSPATELRDGLRVNRFPLSDLSKNLPWMRGVGLINAPWIALQIMGRLWGQIGESDVVHCHIGSLQSIAAACAARLRGVPVICKAAMADDRSDLGEAAKGGVMGRLAASLGRFAFTRWVATTEAVKEALVRAGVAPPLIVVIPNGVDVDVAGDASRSRDRPVRRFLYLGRLSVNAQRDVPGLLQAFDSVAAEVPDVELAVVGGGDLLEVTRLMATACDHGSRIRVTGPGDSVEWLNWADCFVLPSRREGLSNALLEAMAARLPCIAYDIPPNREVLDDGRAGCLVEGNVLALARAMLALVKSRPKADGYISVGYERAVRKYSLAAVSSEYRGLYVALRDRRKRD